MLYAGCVNCISYSMSSSSSNCCQETLVVKKFQQWNYLIFELLMNTQQLPGLCHGLCPTVAIIQLQRPI